jgi:hypothetical protein
MISKPFGTGVAVIFFLLAGLYLGYQQGLEDGREAIRKIRLKPTANSIELLGTEAELVEILQLNDPLERGRLLATKLQTLGPDSVSEVLDAYDVVFFELGDFEFEMLATWWARFDPRAAFEFTRTYWEAAQNGITMAVIRQWASVDPPAAMKALMWAGSDPENPDPWINALVTGWDESGYPGVYDWVLAMGPGYGRQRALMQLVQRQIRRDGPDAAIAWAESLPTGKRNDVLKLNAFRRVAGALAQDNREAATAFTLKYYDSPYGRDLPSWVGRRWSFYEPELALEWLSTLPEGKNRDKGVEDTFLKWDQRDRESLMDWASQQDLEAEWFQPALSHYARRVSLTDINKGLELAGYVHHPQYRMMTVGKIVRNWLTYDPLEARKWLKNSDLTIQERARILGQVAPSPAE